MRKDKKLRMMAIVALTMSVLGLTLGFAAFSNTLTISSSATVTPDASDFKMVIYGLPSLDNFQYDIVEDAPLFTSTTFSVPDIYNTATAGNAIIDNDSLTIKNIAPTIVEPGSSVAYFFKIVNEGKYDAYISADEVHALTQKIASEKQCVPANDTTAAYVAEACNDIDYYLNFLNPQGNDLSIDPLTASSEGSIVIAPNEYVELIIEISYQQKSNQILADGDFDVIYPDLPIEFSTVNPDA